ncbi:uncharacterized protein LOC128681334 [Plodia interpunctella]|uniref:uncharacterized protein LOC128681334 n=1 Tax=Plodia interpunctella TaxID=58824 RepID=UPI0023679B84|nr:uncharacterized protein LOC128681334 [Plodia interpunctella]
MSYSYNNDCVGSPFGHSSRELPIQDMQQLPTYNLWTGSTYHNRSEFIPRDLLFRQNESQSAAANEGKPKRVIERDIFNRRIITKVSLYKEPEFFFEPENELETPSHGPPKTNRCEQSQADVSKDEWTDLYWRRAGVNTSQGSRAIGNRGMATKTRDAQFKKMFMESLAQPIKSSKAESMMQKMGWQGGALGKEGNGIVEPIAPNIDYAQTTIGFGLRTELQAPSKKKKCSCPKKQKDRDQKMEDFVTNALLYILEFVQNDWETEIIFDVKFTSKERRILHQCVNELINESGDELYAGESNGARITNAAQERALRDIRRYNTYVLYTESHGLVPLRQLCLYKDAPEFVYLVTPDDFKEEEEEEEEDNPFLKSIKRNLDADDEIDEPGNLGRLIKYFLEFVRDDSFTEFRFLGAFDNELSECLDTFLRAVSAAIRDEDRDRWRKVFRDESVSFQLIENCNGSMVVHKRKKDMKT